MNDHENYRLMKNLMNINLHQKENKKTFLRRKYFEREGYVCIRPNFIDQLREIIKDAVGKEESDSFFLLLNAR